LTWWLRHHLSELSEAAGDDAALQATGDETLYAEILLGFLAAAPRRVQWDTVAIITRQGKAAKRMDRILDTGRRLSRGLTAPALLLVVLAAVPAIYGVCCAQTATPKPQSSQPSPTPPAEGITGGVQGGIPGGIGGGVPGGVAGGVPGGIQGRVTAGDGFAIVTNSGRRIYGSNVDSRRLQRFAAQGDFVWLRRKGLEYLIRDPETLAEARRIVDQAFLEPELEKASSELERLAAEKAAEMVEKSNANLEHLAEQLAEVAKLQQSLETVEQSKALADLKGKLDVLRQQESTLDLAREMARRSTELKESGSEIRRELESLIDEAFKSGKAQKVK
jgi:hypothetical protein